MFDYWCPDCENYVLLERDENNMLNGWCALCGLSISMTPEVFKKYEEKNKEGR